MRISLRCERTADALSANAPFVKMVTARVLHRSGKILARQLRKHNTRRNRMLIHTQHPSSPHNRTIQQHVICPRDFATKRHIDAYTEDGAAVDGVGVGVLYFVGGDAGAGAVDVCAVAAGLLGD
ncbi:predicted protein [Plenodomus lingam JN3]|uniref:Predicted protein n=1 Tax=Leptosphaeria maculans (strain JN3 / isolate v23.1.3 / race Av1-4-5-6-7-8) TaxID=985895 RepID=E4ZUA7_LEPMJ|nr:predicted protein [Plenodomus lingam JN3]CBX94986.1 predicted protein [Plenodomus lingam JN3]